LPVPVSQKPVVADSVKAFGQAVQQKPADKRHRGDGDRFGAVFLSIFSAEGDLAVFERLNAAVSNSNPAGVARQVLKDMFGSFDRLAYTDHPVFGKQGVFELAIPMAVKF